MFLFLKIFLPFVPISGLASMQYVSSGSRTTTRRGQFPTEKKRSPAIAHQIPRTTCTPHWDNSPPNQYQLVNSLIRTNYVFTVGNCPGGEFSGYRFFLSSMFNTSMFPPCLIPWTWIQNNFSLYGSVEFTFHQSMQYLRASHKIK